MIDDRELLEMEKEIQDIVGGCIVRDMIGLRDGDIYLANSWLGAIHKYVRRQQGDTLHEHRIERDKMHRLAGICNRLGLDFIEVLEAEPRDEVRIILEAIRDLSPATAPPPDWK